MSSIKILVVEDEPIIGIDIQTRLNKLGYFVPDIMRSGEEALEYLKDHQPDLILMDINLGGTMDGIETTQVINQLYPIPVIFLTAYSDKETIQRTNETESHGYILKPIQNEAIYITIERALSKHKSDNALKDKEKLLETTLDSLAEGVVLISQEGIIHKANRKALELIQIPATDKIHGESYERFFSFDMNGDNIDLMATENIIRGDLTPWNKEDTSIPIEATIGVFLQTDRLFTGIVVAFHDITKQLAYEKAILLARERAETHSRLKSEFLTNMTHELRTPLNSVIGMNQLVKEKVNDLYLKDCLDVSINSAQFLLGMISDLLDFSKLESGKMKIARLPFNLGEDLENTFEKIAVQASKKHLLLLTDIPSEAYNIFLGDSGKLSQVINNLVGNAIKFTNQGAISFQCLIDIENKKVDFIIQDTGIGMKVEETKRIFDDFYQIDGSHTRSYGGTGLGLSITKKLIEIMNGKLTVESLHGTGSIFRFDLPLVMKDTLNLSSQLLANRAYKICLKDKEEERLLTHFLEEEGAKKEQGEEFLYFCDSFPIPQEWNEEFELRPYNFFFISDHHQQELLPNLIKKDHIILRPLNRTKIKSAMGLDKKRFFQVSNFKKKLSEQNYKIYIQPDLITWSSFLFEENNDIFGSMDWPPPAPTGKEIVIWYRKENSDIDSFIADNPDLNRYLSILVHDNFLNPSIIKKGKNAGIRVFMKTASLSTHFITAINQLMEELTKEKRLHSTQLTLVINEEHKFNLKNHLPQIQDLLTKNNWHELDSLLKEIRSEYRESSVSLSQFLLGMLFAVRNKNIEKLKDYLNQLVHVINT
ncbi:ATP-binding response regulator [Spirochaeta cellobiosiphila]|uniref:ATP-binding response regulator n=1 Tax=Spirochaeta cellobiosiphila TaxID=504483 RepID=UPI0003FC6577|nr:ATP-binding protein [Spirochaeta cellobiosiphila]